MSALRGLGRAYSRHHDSLVSQGVGRLTKETPVFENTSTLSSKFTFPLIVAQVFVTVVGAELIFNHWTEHAKPAASTASESKTPASTLTPSPSSTSAASSSSTPASSGPSPEPKSAAAEAVPATEFVLRPFWQRAGLVTANIAAGAFILALLVSTRSRILKRAYVLPSSAVHAHPNAPHAPTLPRPPADDRVLVLQNVWHWRGQGYVFPFAGAALRQAASPTEVQLVVPGQKREYTLIVPGAKINGQKLPSEYAIREALYKAWYGEKKGRQELAKTNWAS